MSVVVKVQNVTKVFGKPVLQKISFEMSEGETVALVGANGAGKSTLLKSLLGLICPQEGEILFFEKYSPGCPETRERVGFLPELVGFWPESTPHDILSLCGKNFAPEKIKEVLLEVGLSERANSRIGEFSKGMAQRLGLACLMLRSPRFLILDEPMTGLDFRAQEWLRHFLFEWRKKENTLLISTHSLRDVEYLADRVLVLDDGKLTRSGNKDEILPELYRWREKLT